MSATWHVVHTLPNSEARAAHNLARQGFAAFLPLFLRRIRHARRDQKAARPLFPRYLFVAFDPETAPWRSINGTFGVARLLCRDERPLPVPSAIVDAIRAREDEQGFVRIEADPRFEPGQRVQILEGAFAFTTGLFQQMTESQRVILLLDLLGRQVRVSVSAEAIAAA